MPPPLQVIQAGSLTPPSMPNGYNLNAVAKRPSAPVDVMCALSGGNLSLTEVLHLENSRLRSRHDRRQRANHGVPITLGFVESIAPGGRFSARSNGGRVRLGLGRFHVGRQRNRVDRPVHWCPSAHAARPGSRRDEASYAADPSWLFSVRRSGRRDRRVHAWWIRHHIDERVFFKISVQTVGPAFPATNRRADGE